MNDSFTSPDGFISVSYTDSTPRPRVPISPFIVKNNYTPQDLTEFWLSWLPTYTDQPPKHVPARPARIGVTNVFEAGIAPTAWLPRYPTYRGAPRLHRTYFAFGFDPLSGAALRVAQLMAWDPRQHPIVVRPRLRETLAAFFQVPPQISAGSLTCTAIADTDLTTPAFLNEALTTPTLLTETETVPALVDEGVC